MEAPTTVVPAATTSSTGPVQPLDPREILQKMLDGLGLQTKVEQFTLDGAPLLHIATADPARIIGKHGQTLSQLQFLLNRIQQRRDKDAPRVIVDCERYRERANDDLIRRAMSAADRVRRWGDEVHIGPYGAFDRRVIHRHFQNDRELEAVSEGEEDGGRKKMTIRVRRSSPPAQSAS
jgi:spoIIIJ-associated protein